VKIEVASVTPDRWRDFKEVARTGTGKPIMRKRMRARRTA